MDLYKLIFLDTNKVIKWIKRNQMKLYIYIYYFFNNLK